MSRGEAEILPVRNCVRNRVTIGLLCWQMHLPSKHKWPGLIGWILAVAAVSTFGAQFMPGDWYRALAKPSFTPPSWIFGPVWTALYLMMAIAAWLVWLRHGFREARLGLGLFIFQLILNALWSWIFFGQHWLGVAAVEIVVLWLAILATIMAFRKLSRLAACLMIPYLLWVGYASVLTIAIWRLNAD